MSVLVDTNVLLRRTQPDHEHHIPAVETVGRILASGETVCITPQIVFEFWNVATRPIGNNGLGFTIETALREIELIEHVLIVLPELPSIYAEWRRLVVHHRVIGSKVHDARLVAAMQVHGIRRILTFNTADFVRYGLEVLRPSPVSP